MSKISNKKKAKRVGKFPNGVAHITTTFNNVMITFTDLNGNVLCSNSAGRQGFKGAKKSTPFAAQMVAESVSNQAMEIFSMRTVVIMIKGPGAGRESSIRSVVNSGLIVTLIKDVTPLPHNGCRKPKRRRV